MTLGVEGIDRQENRPGSDVEGFLLKSESFDKHWRPWLRDCRILDVSLDSKTALPELLKKIASLT